MPRSNPLPINRTALAVVALVALVVGWSVLHVWIQNGVEKFSAVAQVDCPVPGDDVASLIAYVQSESHSLKERNRAIWALGQLRDPRALPVLEAAHTGDDCDHSTRLCQRELHNAIKLCRGDYPNFLHIRARSGQGQ